MKIIHKLLFVLSLCNIFASCDGTCSLESSDLNLMKKWTGIISSPGYELGIYENSQDCTWEIKAAWGNQVKVTFHEFDLEESRASNGTKVCTDYVQINDSSGILFHNCGFLSTPLEVTASGDSVTIHFHSDESGALSGFEATYTGVCAYEVTNNSVITIPSYPAGVTCTWKIGHPALFTVMKVLKTNQTPGDRNATTLPKCGKSPLKIISDNGQGGSSELCGWDLVQVYKGNITLINNPSSISSDNWTGKIIIDLANEMDCTKFCVHSSSCRPVNDSNRIWFNCLCKDGFEGLTCEDKIDSCPSQSCANGSNSSKTTDAAHCPQERDLVPGSHISWSYTLAKQFDTQPCPEGANGSATRNCIVDQGSPSGGFWTRPDLSNCVSWKVLQVSIEAEELTKNTSNVAISKIMEIMSRLVDVTDLVLDSNINWHPLLPGDLITVTDILEDVSKLAVETDLELAGTLIQRYIRTVDNIVDPKSTDIWGNALASIVETRITSVVKSTQEFFTNIMRSYPNIGHIQTSRLTEGSVGDKAGNTTLLEVAGRNIDVRILESTWKNETPWEFEYSSKTSSVIFPGISTNTSHITFSDGSVNIYLARFTSVSTLLSISESRYHKECQNDSNLVNSDVVSVEFLDVPKTIFNNLPRPVVLTFAFQDQALKSQHVEQCVFMNMKGSTYKDRWSATGCLVAESNQTHVMCLCHHLTNFAVLMDVYNNQDKMNPQHKVMLTYISYIGGSLSILACIITIVVFQYFRLSSDRISIHQHLSLSIISVQILFICVGKTGKDYGTPTMGCRVVAALMHYFLTAMFCWMLVEGTHLYIVLVRVFKRGSHFKKYLAFGWGIPLIIVGISIGAFYDKYGTGRLCWLNQELLLVCFVPTVGLVVLIAVSVMNFNVSHPAKQINTVILVIVVQVMIKSNNSTQKFQAQERNNITMSLKAAAVLLPLLGLTWIFGFLAVNAPGTETVSYVFTYLFTIVNSCQGVLLFIFHCLLNVDVRQAYERRYNPKKKLSYIETTSSRLRKLSEPDPGSNCNVLHTQRSKPDA